MTTGITIYRRDGTVAFVAEKATTMREAVEQAAKSRANLSRANLYGANLSRANLTRAYLTGTDLTGADLTGADLTGADLTGADLTGADLTGANLTRADLTRAVGAHYATIGPVDGWMVALCLTGDGLRISAGCRYFTVPEAREHWGDPLRWTAGTSPEHGARMLAAVDALLDLAADWPEKLPEAQS